MVSETTEAGDMANCASPLWKEPGMAEGPIVRKRRLALEMKKCREQAGMTQEQVGRHFEWHASKVTRMETARVKITPRDVKDLLELYGNDDPEYRENMLSLSRNSTERGWWVGYKSVMRPGNFIGLESEAAALRDWSPLVVPGLLQTEAYMTALMRAGQPNTPVEELERHIELRKKRQARLASETDPLHLTAIIDEAVLIRTVGGAATMREQLQRLLEMSEVPTVNMQVLSLDAGEHFMLGGPAVLVELTEASELDVVFLEGLAGEYYEEEPHEVAGYRRVFERLSATASSLKETRQMIRKAMEKYTS